MYAKFVKNHINMKRIYLLIKNTHVSTSYNSNVLDVQRCIHISKV